MKPRVLKIGNLWYCGNKQGIVARAITPKNAIIFYFANHVSCLMMYSEIRNPNETN